MRAQRNMQLPPFAEGVRGQLLLDEPMSRHTSWRVGGPADYFYTPADEDDLALLLSRLPSDYPLYWIGLGSNLLVRDGGIRGMVICICKSLRDIRVTPAPAVFAQAGISCAKVARFSVLHGFVGAEFLAGVPGSFGGALAMNAGAFGGQTWQWVDSVRWMHRDGTIVERSAAQVDWQYRQVGLPPDTGFLSGVLALEQGQSVGSGRSKIRRLLEQRNTSQPIQSASAGSVFKNPCGQYAAELLQQAGLKGRRIGDAEFSHKHANFIVNHGRATATEIESLIQLGQEAVQQRYGVWLQPEVRLIGRPI